MRAFLTARSAPLEFRWAVGGRLRVPSSGARGATTAPVLAGMSASMSARSIGRLTAKKKRRNKSIQEEIVKTRQKGKGVPDGFRCSRGHPKAQRGIPQDGANSGLATR